MVARSIDFSSSLQPTSLEAVVSSYRYVSAWYWDWESSSSTDALWVNTYDFSRLSGSTTDPVLT